MDSIKAAVKYAEEECERTKKEVESRKYFLRCGEDIYLQAQDHLNRLTNMQVNTTKVADKPQRTVVTDAEIAAGIIERRERLRFAEEIFCKAWDIYTCFSNSDNFDSARIAQNDVADKKASLVKYINDNEFSCSFSVASTTPVR